MKKITQNQKDINMDDEIHHSQTEQMIDESLTLNQAENMNQMEDLQQKNWIKHQNKQGELLQEKENLMKEQKQTKKETDQSGLQGSDQQSDYIKSIRQIKRILSQKQYKTNKFIQTILKDFSPYVFQKQQLQSDPDQWDVIQFEQQNQKTSPKPNQKSYPTNKQSSTSKDVMIDAGFFDTKWIDELQQNCQLKKMLNFNVIFHSRVIFILMVLTSEKYPPEKTYNLRLSKDLQQLKLKLLQNKIRYSFDYNVWNQISLSKKYQKTTQYLQSKQNSNVIPAQIKKDKLFNLIDNFYHELGFSNKNHSFNKRICNLTDQMYRVKFIKEFAFYSFSTKEQVFKYLKDQSSQRFKNIEFYCNKQTATSRNLTLQKIHKNKAKDYQWLQRTHDYIQWLFPNHFQSQFNGSSYSLGYVEAQLFKNDIELRQKLLRSFQIFIDFMGCEIKYSLIQNNLKQKELKCLIWAVNDKKSEERLRDCLIQNTHNHLRIMRILACLSVTGLRKYAQAFLGFLNGLKYNKRIQFERIRSPLQKNWNSYSSLQPQKKQKALEMCFTPYQDFLYLRIQNIDSNLVEKKRNTDVQQKGKQKQANLFL